MTKKKGTKKRERKQISGVETEAGYNIMPCPKSYTMGALAWVL